MGVVNEGVLGLVGILFFNFRVARIWHDIWRGNHSLKKLTKISQLIWVVD